MIRDAGTILLNLLLEQLSFRAIIFFWQHRIKIQNIHSSPNQQKTKISTQRCQIGKSDKTALDPDQR